MTLLIVIIVLALIFDYINGFHDAANSIATVVSTKVLTPFQAVIWAAFFNVVAYFIFQDHAVANTISKTVNKEFITLNVILAGLIAAIFWNLLTWWYGIPSSSSHTLIGGFAGAAIAHAMMTKGLTISWSKVVENDTIIKTVLFIFFAPMIGMIISIFINIVTILRNMWLRMGIIILATALTVLLFDRFETNKMNQGLEKFIKLDKYKLEVAKAEETLEKDNNNEKAKEDLVTAEKKLSGAKDIYAKIVPLIVEFDKIGADSIAAFAYHNGLLTDIEVSKLKDEVRNANNFLILESLSADNAEKKKDIKGVEYAYHYKWPEMYNNGFSFLGNIITTNGLQTKTLSQAPTAGNLKNASIYMIVDADNIADNPTPNYMNDRDAQEIYNWVKAGGVLVLFHNDKPNADFTAINKLSDLFGIHFNEDTYNKVIGINYLGGKIDVPAGHQILKNVQTIYQKEVCSITVKAPAKSVLTKGDLVVFATAKIGKGTVFATGDPWLYNEYTDGRMLPAMYQNAEAAKDLVKWLISQIPGKK